MAQLKGAVAAWEEMAAAKLLPIATDFVKERISRLRMRSGDLVHDNLASIPSVVFGTELTPDQATRLCAALRANGIACHYKACDNHVVFGSIDGPLDNLLARLAKLADDAAVMVDTVD